MKSVGVIWCMSLKNLKAWNFHKSLYVVTEKAPSKVKKQSLLRLVKTWG